MLTNVISSALVNKRKDEVTGDDEDRYGCRVPHAGILYLLVVPIVSVEMPVAGKSYDWDLDLTLTRLKVR